MNFKAWGLGAASLVAGIVIGVVGLIFFPRFDLPFIDTSSQHATDRLLGVKKPEIFGFAPYWLLSKLSDTMTASQTPLTTFSYFALTISPDGKIVKMDNAKEENPGWTNLKSQRLKDKLDAAQSAHLTTSLVIQGGEDDVKAITQQPHQFAQTMMAEVVPIMKQYHFTDLNLDFESFHTVTPDLQQNYTAFVIDVKKTLQDQQLGTLSIDLVPAAVVKTYAMDVPKLGQLADHVILMTYDYSSKTSSIAGPVAPTHGIESNRNFDVTVSVQEAIKVIPPEKILLGIPLYGYQWDTQLNTESAPIVPTTGSTLTQIAAKDLVASCQGCLIGRDDTYDESYIVQPQTAASGSAYFHQTFYEDIPGVKKKIALAQQYKLGGVALWALGYEDPDIVPPLRTYKSTIDWEK